MMETGSYLLIYCKQPAPNFRFRKGELQVSTDGHTEVCLLSCRAIVTYLCIAFLLPAVCSSIPLCVPNVIFPPESYCVLLNPMSELPVESINIPTLPTDLFFFNTSHCYNIYSGDIIS